jgi:hypothetical protein
VAPQNSRIFFCGPKQLQSALVLIVAKMMNMTVEEVGKRKMIVY